MRPFTLSSVLALALVSQTASGATIGQVSLSPSSTSVGVGVAVLVTAQIPDTSVIGSSVNLQRLDAQGRVLSIVGTLVDDGTSGDATATDRVFSLRFSVYEEQPGPLIFRVSAGVQGSLTRIFSTPTTLNVIGSVSTGITISQPANLIFLNTSPVTVSGSTGDPAAGVTVNGIQASKNSASFQASIPLQEGNNTVTAVATNSNGTTSTQSIQITLDTTPPRVTVDFPLDGSSTIEATTTVSGIVNDIVVGTVNSQQGAVTVNGIPASVSNRTFTAPNIPLQLGLNTIQVIGRDQTGNSATTIVKILREAVIQPSIKLISGNNQTGVIGSQLPAPLVVQLLNGSTPVANAAVIFKVTKNDGFFASAAGNHRLISVNTNAQGQAQASLVLGNRAGVGNNSVEAYAGGFQGTALFTASATTKRASRINVDSGNNQFGPVNQRLVLPFVAVVTDEGFNRIAGVSVTFSVRQGGGSFNGAASFQTVTDGDGRALGVLTLGSQPGQDNNIVEASFQGSTSYPATFSASAKVPGNPTQTTVSGLVLDNSNLPIPGVTMRMFRANLGSNNNQPHQVTSPVVTDAKGIFKISSAPVGVFKLMADGTTAALTGKQYPTLEYDIVTISGQDNSVGMPIYLPALDPLAKVCVNATTGGVLTLPKSPGFSLTILPGSATFPGGSKTGCVSSYGSQPR